MLKSFFSDEEYFKKLYIIGLPLIIQQVVTNSVNLIDTLMIGSFELLL
mgnify:FL=1